MTGSPTDDTAAYNRHAPIAADAVATTDAVDAVALRPVQEWRARHPAPR